MTFDLETRLDELAGSDPTAIPVLESHGIDYCCRGRRPFGEACRSVGLDPQAVAAELAAARRSAAAAAAADAVDWRRESLAALTGHIVARHHEYLRRELPVLDQRMAKVLQAHGANHPELRTVGRRLEELGAELMQHMLKEEQVLFPMIRALEAGDDAVAAHCGSVANPIAVMEHEHDDAGEALREMRSATGGYAPPPDACATYTALLHGLAELERDLHLHIHLENNILHPRTLELEAARGDRLHVGREDRS